MPEWNGEASTAPARQPKFRQRGGDSGVVVSGWYL